MGGAISMANGRPTVNGLAERIKGVEGVMREKINGVCSDIGEIKDDIRLIRENELAHLRADIESLKKFQWKILGALSLLWVLVQIGIKILAPLIGGQ
jgi:polyhydroxyalkanoate synthesis regulator phasin